MKKKLHEPIGWTTAHSHKPEFVVLEFWADEERTNLVFGVHLTVDEAYAMIKDLEKSADLAAGVTPCPNQHRS